MIARDMLLIQRRKKVIGSAGQTEHVDDGAPVEIRANVHPLSTDLVEQWGERGRDTRQLVYRGTLWPGDLFSEITFEGAKWDQVAPAQHAGKGARTRHWEVIIRKR